MAIDASIPLQVNPQIPLQARPAQIDNPLDVYLKAQAAKSNKQQMQMGEMQLQEAKQRQADDQAVHRAYMESQGNLDDFEERARNYGASPDRLLKLKQQNLELRQGTLKLTAEQRADHLAKMDQIRGMLLPIDDILASNEPDAEERAQWAFYAAYENAKKQGLADEKSDQATTAIFPDGRFTRDRYQVFKNSLSTGTQLISEANKADQTAARLLQAQVAQQRADAYSRSIDSLTENRVETMKFKRDQLAEQIERDTNLDEFRRGQLRQQLEVVDKQIAAAAARQAAGISATRSNLEYTQEQINARTDRVQTAITDRLAKKGVTGPQALRTMESALRITKALPGFANLSEEDQIATINTLIDSGIGNVQPVVSTQPGEPRTIWQEYGKGTPPSGPKVTPGAPIARPTATAPAPAPAQKIATKADVQAYAAENRVDYATAEKAFKAKGYTIR